MIRKIIFTLCFFNMSTYLSATQISNRADMTALPVAPLSILEPSVAKVFENGNLHNLEITLPDLHGNALKLLHSMLFSQIITIKKKDFLNLYNCYLYKNINIDNARKFTKFWGLKLKAGPKKSVKLVRLIGDEFSDRGQNDLFTLHLLKGLNELGVKVEHILSNHSFDFFAAWEIRDFFQHSIHPAFLLSRLNVAQFIKHNIFAFEEVSQLLEQYILPNLKLISYSHNKDSNLIVVYTHAPAGLGEIRTICRIFNIQYKDDTAENLAKTIDEINECFKAEYIHKKRIHKLDEEIIKFVWNRNITNLERPNIHNGYNIMYVHGHDPSSPSNAYIFNLDHRNELGKGSEDIDMHGQHRFFLYHPHLIKNQLAPQ